MSLIQQHSVYYYIFAFLKGSILSLNGKVSVGKSTFGQAAATFLNAIGFRAKFFPEDIDEDYLGMYLANRPKYAFGFQKDTLNRRMAIHREAEAFAASGGIAIIDRDIYGDISFAKMQFQEGLFNAVEWAIYKKEIERAKLHRPTYMIHLMCNAATAIQRNHERGNADKDAYTEADMIALEDATVSVLDEYYTGPLLKLKWERNLSKSGHHDLSTSGNTKVDITDEVLIEVFQELKDTFNVWLMEQQLKLKYKTEQ